MLRSLADQLEKAKSVREGTIAFHFTDGTSAALQCAPGEVKVVEIAAIAETSPVIEIIGDRKKIQDVAEGKKDARRQYVAGGLRVRGDLRYFSDVALELGILTEPL